MSGIVTTSYGGTGGTAFDRSIVEEIGLDSGGYVDPLRINNVAHGGSGGQDRGSLVLGTNEYISNVYVRAGGYVDHLKFTTNLNRTLEGGGDGGNPTTLNNIRVLTIAGRAGGYLDHIEFMYVTDYSPSSVAQARAPFIIGFTPPNTVMEEYEDTEYKTVESYQRVTTSMMSQKYSASVEGEYYVKVSAATEITFENTDTTTISSELDKRLATGSKTTTTIPDDHVGILQVEGDIFKADDNVYWMTPNTIVTYAVIKTTDYANVLGYYDLTGLLQTQMPDLKAHATVQNGYTYYKA